MTKQEQIVYKIASAIQWNASDDYVTGLIEMASIVLERDQQTICAMVKRMMA